MRQYIGKVIEFVHKHARIYILVCNSSIMIGLLTHDLTALLIGFIAGSVIYLYYLIIITITLRK